MKKALFMAAFSITVCSALLLMNCSSNPKKAEKSLITLSGAFAIYPTAVQWAEAFQKTHPAVKVEVSAGGAGKGAADCIAGLVDIGMVSREPDKSELEKGITALKICHDGVFVIMNEKNPAAGAITGNGMTRTQLFDLYKSQKKLTWEELSGAKDSAKTPVNIYTRSDACGAASTFARFVGKLKQEDLTGIGVNTDPQMINAVLNDVNGISYTNFSYVFNKDGSVIQGVKVIPIDTNENGKLEPEEAVQSRAEAITAIEKGIYPIARINYFFHRGKPQGITKEFIEFCLGEEGTKILNEVGTSLPLPREDRDKVLAEIK